MSQAEQVVRPRKRVAKGPRRPRYLENAELDKFMMMLTAALAEISALRDRMDTYESLSRQGGSIATEEVERYRPTEAERETREARRAAMLSRVFRILLEEAEEARAALSTRDLEQVLEADGAALPEAERLNT